MNNNEKRNNNNWKVAAATFQGFVKAKIEDIEQLLKDHCEANNKNFEQIETDMKLIQDYITADRAVKKFKVGLWGMVGGLFGSLLIGFLLLITKKWLGF